MSMIWALSDLSEAERQVLAQAARVEVEKAEDSDAAKRWEDIAVSIENGGKEPHSVKPGTYTPLDGGPR
ncbi:hypothetical protein ACFWMR_01950 [Amycolatopsis thailandensis]|uniref:hypothetical protein n=1 Tax=Amycolatopsis thailandensis TaxID=589330 RepID=UPI0036465FEB